MKTLLMTASLIGLVTMGASVGAAPATPTAYFVGEDMDGNIFAVPLDQGAVDHAAACGGTAPLVTACGTGTHTMTSGWSLSHGVVVACATVPVPTSCTLTRMVSVVSGGGNTRTFACDVGTPYQFPFLGISCSGSGSFPRTTFTHNCSAEGWRGVAPVGAGDWGCRVLFHSN